MKTDVECDHLQNYRRKLLPYLLEAEQRAEEVGSIHHLEGLIPGRFDTRPFRVWLHGVKASLEEQEAGIHDAHDEMRRLGQLTHSGNVGWLDGLQSGFSFLQGRAGRFQFLHGLSFVHL